MVSVYWKYIFTADCLVTPSCTGGTSGNHNIMRVAHSYYNKLLIILCFTVEFEQYGTNLSCEATMLIAECLSVRLIIVQVWRVLVGSQSEAVLVSMSVRKT